MATINTKKAAEIIGIKEQSLRRWRMSGIGPPSKISVNGRTVEYDDVEVKAWAQRHMVVRRKVRR